MSKRIAFLTFSYPRFANDESSVFLKRLVEGYDAVGASGVVIVPFDHDEPKRETEGSFTVVRYKYGLFSAGRLAFGSGIMPNLRSNPFLLFQVPLFLLCMVIAAYRERHRYDVIHANWVVSAFAAWGLHLLSAKPYIVTIRGEDIRLLRHSFFRLLCIPALSRANRIVSVSNAFSQELKSILSFPEEKMVCVPNGVYVPEPSDEELTNCCDDYGLRREGKYILFVGRVLRLKRVHVLIELLSKPQLKGYELIICGRVKSKEYLAELKKQVSARGLEKRVHFTGAVSPRVVASLLRISRYYASASETEGRPNSVLEAHFTGLPVLLSDIPGHREVTEGGKAGVLFQVEELETLAQHIETLDAERSSYEELSSKGKHFASSLSWERCAKEYLQALEKEKPLTEDSESSP